MSRGRTGAEVHYLPALLEAVGEPPEDIGSSHPMRKVTEDVADDPRSWTPAIAKQVAGFFDEMAAGWAASGNRARGQVVLEDLLTRSELPSGLLVELGAGTGSGTVLLQQHFEHVLAGDLSAEMLKRLPEELASRLQLDSSALPFATGSVTAVACVNMMLFADEVVRVLTSDGVLIWVNSIGERTPIYLSADRIAQALAVQVADSELGGSFEVTASTAHWGTWAVARRQR
ncbi:MAG: class I SAM-dependent methyltransferase [Actinobacteria bacterium]|nr:class I SAM-dependent methyltransferase [Actinomycetota bacterium]